MTRLLFALLLALLSVPIACAQPGADEQLAAQYFQQGDFEKAAMYYERLHRKQPNDFYYEQLLKSYTSMTEYGLAEKLVKEQMRRANGEPRYIIDLGGLYKTMDEPDKAAKEYDKAIRQMRADQGSIRQVANAFIQANETDRALEAYERGSKMLPQGSSFAYEIAGLYGTKGDTPRMVSAYMDLLAVNEGYIQAVQNALSRYIDFSIADERSEILRTELLRRIQKDPQRNIICLAKDTSET